jgi:hypothetical protein
MRVIDSDILFWYKPFCVAGGCHPPLQLIDHFHGNPAATSFIAGSLLAGEQLIISVASV